MRLERRMTYKGIQLWSRNARTEAESAGFRLPAAKTFSAQAMANVGLLQNVSLTQTIHISVVLELFISIASESRVCFTRYAPLRSCERLAFRSLVIHLPRINPSICSFLSFYYIAAIDLAKCFSTK